MKIGFVSVFPPDTNGIGDYTYDLARAILAECDDASVIVFGNKAGEMGGLELEVEVDRCWSTRATWARDILGAVDRAKPDVVHIQHGYYMGRDGRVPDLLEGLARRNVRGVTTLHAIYQERFRRLTSIHRWRPPKFHQALVRYGGQILIHQREGAYEALVAHGVPEQQISVIPHGTPTEELPSRSEARRLLELPDDAPIALFLGFISHNKGVHTVVHAFDRVVEAVPSARLVIVGRPESDFPNPQYVWWLRRQMRRGCNAGWIDYRPGYVAAEHIPAYLSAADVVVFPYRQRYGSASGILHRAYGAGRAILCSRGPKFAEAAEIQRAVPEAFAAPGEPSEWGRSLIQLLGDPELRDRVAMMSADLGQRSSWGAVARQHVEMYRSLIDDRERARWADSEPR